MTVHQGDEEILLVPQESKESSPSHVYSPPVVVTYPEVTTTDESGCIHMCGSSLLYLIMIIFCPFACIFFMIYPCCSLKGRESFMHCLKCCYMNCCCRFDCVSSLSLKEAMSRYEEDPFMSSNVLIATMVRNRFLISILETLNIHLPDFFFAFLPSGSLRERFGKLLPSSSVLASDYDIMLIPDGVSVGEEGEVYQNVQTPVFSAIDVQGEHGDGYLWLKLEDKYLLQWEQLCLRKHIKDEGCSLLSNTNIREKLRKVLTESQEIRSAVESRYQSYGRNTIITSETNGPAFTLKIRAFESSTNLRCFGYNCADEAAETTFFHADFTFALHCCFWPKNASGFFNMDRRKYWPSVEVINTIKRLGCHVVPKSSTNALVKLTCEQAEYTTYGRSPGLEWRYSFSQAEMILSDNIPIPARTAYLSLKAINKRHLDTKGRPMGSYTLKCILFWLVETKEPEYWQSDHCEEEFLMEMLNRLNVCFEYRICPNYWIPTMNVFANGLTGSDCARKLRLLNEIIKAPKEYVADQWLEHTRCIRLNCCYCGDSGYISQYVESTEVRDTYVEQPGCGCLYKCKYDNRTTCCGPCEKINRKFDVY